MTYLTVVGCHVRLPLPSRHKSNSYRSTVPLYNTVTCDALDCCTRTLICVISENL
jgi:hypothetical protein